jgi:hypothetical protein
LIAVLIDCSTYGQASADDCAKNSIKNHLQAAVNNQDLDMVKFLVEKGADVNNGLHGSNEDVGYAISPLGTSLRFPDKSIAKFLIENGAKLDGWEKDYIAGSIINDIDGLKIAHSLGANLDTHCYEGGECFTYSNDALVNMNEDVIKYFLENGIFALSPGGVCWLMKQCCDEKTKNIIKIVFNEKNANLRAADCNDWYCQKGGYCASGMIPEDGYPSSYAEENSLKTMLMFLQENHPEEIDLIDFLISKGATPKGNMEDFNNILLNYFDKVYHNGYYYGIRSETENAIFDKLISYGADINVKDKNGKTMLDKASNQEMRDFLISLGAKPAGNSDTANAAADGN